MTTSLQGSLQLYYERLFPADLMYQWLAAGDPVSFARREFSFTLPGDVYLRFRSFADGRELRSDLVKKLPEKMDIGGVYNHPPNKKDAVSVFHAVEKELVFDVDASDYDDVRVCCQDKKICTQCWPLMVCAAQVIDFALSEYFGLHHNAYVFSGRRGLHCWTCDKRGRLMSDEERTCIINFLHLYEGGDKKKLKLDFSKRIPVVFEQLLARFVEPTFLAMFASDANPENNLLQPKTQSSILGLMEHLTKNSPKPMEAVRKALTDSRLPTAERWAEACNAFRKTPFTWVPKYVMFAFAYPRLDVNVSKLRAHLLKSPFVVHPGTGNICLAMSVDAVQQFDPAQCPTLNDALLALERGDRSGGLLPHLQWFESFVHDVNASARGDCEECREYAE